MTPFGLRTGATPDSSLPSKRSVQRHSWRVAKWLLAAALTALFGLPLGWMLVSSFRPVDDFLSNLYPLTLDTIVPRSLSLENYEDLIQGGFLKGVWNSIVASAWTIFAGLAVCVPAAFALGVLRFSPDPPMSRGRRSAETTNQVPI